VKIIASFVAAALVSLPIAAPAQERTFAPNENLVAEGIPPIPYSVVDDVGPYTEFRSASLAGWHPTRKEMLIVTRFGDTPQVHRVTMPGGARSQVTFFPDRIQSASYDPKNPDTFVFSRDTGGNEFSQIYRYDLDSAKVTLLTDGKSKNDVGPWSTAGDRMAYTSTRRNGADDDLYVVDPSNASSDRKVADVEGGGWGPLDWSPDDKTLVVGEFLSANESFLWLFDVATGSRTALTPKSGTVPVAYGGALYSKDGKGLYVTTDKDPEFQRLVYMDLATKNQTVLTAGLNWDVEEFDLSEDGKTLAFVTNEDGASVLHLMDTKSRKELPAPKVPTGVISGISWHKDSATLGFVLSSARSPADVYSIDVKRGTLARWTASETGGLNTASFSEPSLVRWKSFDDRSISGFLYRPPAKFTGKRPVIINIHGGPESQFRPAFMGRSNYFMSELGVAMICPNVRGSSGYGKTFLTLDNGFKREESVKDIGALLDWIAQQPDLDASRVMVMGGSYGGYMSLAVATMYPNRIRCNIDVVGISNFVTFLERTEAYRRDLRRVEYGDERDPKMREYMLAIAPINKAKNITNPMFVVQGKNDPRVPINESEQMVATIKSIGTPVWYLMAQDEGHGFAKKKNADFQFYATILFVRKYLLN